MVWYSEGKKMGIGISGYICDMGYRRDLWVVRDEI
jgi:hypothetical protein